MNKVYERVNIHKMDKLTTETLIRLHENFILIDDSVVIEEFAKFNPRDYFIENKRKIKYCLGDYFKEYILSKAEVISHLLEIKFFNYQFIKTIYDKEIMEIFSISKSQEKNGLISREMALQTIAYLTSKQPNGEIGTLLNNGLVTIIGYTLCKDKIIRVVYVIWDKVKREWGCYACNIGKRWFVGRRMMIYHQSF